MSPGDFQRVQHIINDTPLLSEVMDEYAKIQEVGRRLKSRAYVEFNHAAYKGAIADDLSYVLKKAHEYGIDAKDLQSSINDTHFRPSMTAHPTNPVSHTFTKRSIALVDALIDHPEMVGGRIAELVAEPVYSLDKKTQENEIEEGLVYLQAVYGSLDEEYRILQEAIDGSSYAGEITLPNNINQPRVWMAGDGDGNKNATRTSLLRNIEMFRHAIKARYTYELQDLGFDREFDLQNSQDPAELIDFLEKKIEDLESLNIIDFDDEGEHFARIAKIQSLIRKVSSFGYHFAKIDIRHTAVDLVKIDNVVATLSERLGEDRSQLVQKIIFEESYLDEVNPEGKGEVNQMIIRLLGRFEVVAKNPEMFDKAIIAEFNESSQVQAVMRILKDTGNKVSEPGATLNITPLAESKANLEKLHDDVVTAMDDPEYMAHLKETKKIYFMIARSDTVRRNGVGAQFSQEKAIRKTTAEIMRKLILDDSITNEELAQFEVVPYSGGGAALQRGGGRMIELPSVYGRYCLEAIQMLHEEYQDQPAMLDRLYKMVPKEPFLTTQGHQNGLMYDHGAETMAAFFSQGLYAKLKIKGQIPDSQRDILALRNYYMEQAADILGDLDDFEVSDIVKYLTYINQDRLAVRLDAAFKEDVRDRNAAFIAIRDYEINDVIDDISEKCVKIYTRDIGDEDSDKASPVDKLLINGPWLFTKRGNKSSRASKRGVAEGGETIETVLQALGIKDGASKEDVLRILKQRAIGVESLSSHSGTNVVSWLGLSESIREFREEHPEIDLKELFHVSKSFRDIIRSAEMSVKSCYFKKSWEMLCPEVDEIPDDELRKALHASYMEKITSGREDEISNYETLAYIQEEAIQSIELFTEIAGHELSPNAHQEIEFNRESIATSSKVQRKLNNLFNKDPSIEVTESVQRLTDTTYIGVDAGAAKSPKLMEPQRERDVSREVAIPLAEKMENIVLRAGHDVPAIPGGIPGRPGGDALAGDGHFLAAVR